MKIRAVLGIAGIAVVVDLLMGLPAYGLVRTIGGGTYDYRGAGIDTLGWVMLCGLPGVAVMAALVFWLCLR